MNAKYQKRFFRRAVEEITGEGLDEFFKESCAEKSLENQGKQGK